MSTKPQDWNHAQDRSRQCQNDWWVAMDWCGRMWSAHGGMDSARGLDRVPRAMESDKQQVQGAETKEWPE